MTHEQMYQRALADVAKRLGGGASVIGTLMFDALVAREILAVIAANSENPGYERAGALATLALSRETPASI
ncbi:hypothetical protein [Cupriavidus sp. CP313]